MSLEKFLVDSAKQLEIDLTQKQIDRFMIYKDFLIEYNEKVNLTSIIEPNEILIKHFIDSIALIPFIEKEKSSKKYSAIDVGTGAGFPGIPIKIIKENLNLTLLDSTNKKVVFLKEIVKNWIWKM